MCAIEAPRASTLELPQIICLLSELAELAMARVREAPHSPDWFMRAQLAQRLLLDIVKVVELRDLSMGQRGLERSLSRLRDGDGLEP
jgi:hypothetical protein